MNQNQKTKYDDIIRLPHHESTVRPGMQISNRAAQFSPFAALTGYDAAVRETARLTDTRIELDDDRKDVLNEKLQVLARKIGEHPKITVTYFVSDKSKSGGSYIRVSDHIKKLDEYKRILIMMDGTKIPIDEIYDIDK